MKPEPRVLKRHQPSYANISSRCGHQVRSTTHGQHNSTIFVAKSNDICAEFTQLHKRLLSSKKFFIDKDFNLEKQFPGCLLKRPHEVCPGPKMRSNLVESGKCEEAFAKLGRFKIGPGSRSLFNFDILSGFSWLAQGLKLLDPV